MMILILYGDEIRMSYGYYKGFNSEFKRKILLLNTMIKKILERLDYMSYKIKERGNVLFEKTIEAQMKKDTYRAALYAQEVAEITKIQKTMFATRLSLERLSLRLETAESLGDLVMALRPAASLIRELRGVVRTVIPGMSIELMELEETIESIDSELRSGIGIEGFGGSSAIVNEEAKRILEEATAVAAQKIKEEFPDTPIILNEVKKKEKSWLGDGF